MSGKFVANKSVSTSYLNKAAFFVLCSLLSFAVLVRGAVFVWAQAVLMALSALLCLTILLDQLRAGQIGIPRTPFDSPILAFVFIVILSSVTSRYWPDSIEAILLLVSYVSVFYSTEYLTQTRERQRGLVYMLIALGVFIIVLGLFKRFTAIDLGWWIYPDDLPKEITLLGPYGNHNHMAGYLEMVIPLVISLFGIKSRNGGALILLVFLFVFFLAAHILTLSRAGWISLSLAMFLVICILAATQKSYRKKLLIFTLASVTIAIFVLLLGTQTVERLLTLTENETLLGLNGRMQAWRGTAQMIADAPLLGSGPGTFATLYPHYQPPGMAVRFFEAHNDYLQFLSELGIGVIPVLGWLGYAIAKRGALIAANTSRQARWIGLGALMGILAISIHSVSDFNLHIPANALVCVGLLALCGGQLTPGKNKNISAEKNMP